MNREHLAVLIQKHFTQRDIAKYFGVSLTTTQYWLKHFGLKTHHGPRGIPRNPTIRRECACGETDQQNFYGNRWNRCKPCDNRRTAERGRANRAYALNLLGGKCLCGFAAPVALDIHHKDATVKDVAFRTMRTWSLERIKKELETCILLCKNCHALEHERLRAGVA